MATTSCTARRFAGVGCDRRSAELPGDRRIHRDLNALSSVPVAPSMTESPMAVIGRLTSQRPRSGRSSDGSGSSFVAAAGFGRRSCPTCATAGGSPALGAGSRPARRRFKDQSGRNGDRCGPPGTAVATPASASDATSPTARRAAGSGSPGSGGQFGNPEREGHPMDQAWHRRRARSMPGRGHHENRPVVQVQPVDARRRTASAGRRAAGRTRWPGGRPAPRMAPRPRTPPGSHHGSSAILDAVENREQHEHRAERCGLQHDLGWGGHIAESAPGRQTAGAAH